MFGKHKMNTYVIPFEPVYVDVHTILCILVIGLVANEATLQAFTVVAELVKLFFDVFWRRPSSEVTKGFEGFLLSAAR